MKKLLAFGLLSFVLVGGGCFQKPSPESEPVPPTASEPPAITMTESGTVHAGVQGSYCYGPMCVDKIAPADLIVEAGAEFEAAASRNVTITSAGDLSALEVSMMSESGVALSCTVETKRVSPREYTATLCGPAGQAIVNVFVQFEAGGDSSVFFPVTLK